MYSIALAAAALGNLDLLIDKLDMQLTSHHWADEETWSYHTQNLLYVVNAVGWCEKRNRGGDCILYSDNQQKPVIY